MQIGQIEKTKNRENIYKNKQYNKNNKKRGKQNQIKIEDYYKIYLENDEIMQ